jgi:hypothetical protein
VSLAFAIPAAVVVVLIVLIAILSIRITRRRDGSEDC